MSSVRSSRPGVDIPLGPTRDSEFARIMGFLDAGESVLIVARPGDGSSELAAAVARAVDPSGNALLCASVHTDPADLSAFLSGEAAGPKVIDLAELLPESAGAVLAEALVRPVRPAVMYVADGFHLRSVDRAGPGPLAQLVAAWGRGGLRLLDLALLGDDEIGRLIDHLLPPGTLDDLQRRTVISLADGEPMVAVDLVQDAMDDPARAPRRYPRIGADPLVPGRRATLRLASHYANLDACLVGSALAVGWFSPLEVGTAARLVGHEHLAELLSMRIARDVEVDGRGCINVSPLHVMALERAHPQEGAEARERIHQELRRLWEVGYPISGAWLLAEARRLFGASEVPTSSELRLMVDAAQLDNRFGRPDAAAVAERYVGEALRVGGFDQNSAGRLIRADLDGQILVTQLLLGRHSQALRTAHLVLEEQCEILEAARLDEDPVAPGGVPFDGVPGDVAAGRSHEAMSQEVLHWVSLALSWVPERPQWLEGLLDRLANSDPGSATVMRGCLADPDVGSGDFQRVADSDSETLDSRLRALGVLCMYHLNQGDGKGLLDASHQGRRLVELVDSEDKSCVGPVPSGAVRFFRFMSALCCALAGMSPEHYRESADWLIDSCAGLSGSACWPLSADAALMQTIVRIREGDGATAARNVVAVTEEARPAMLPSLWYLACGLGEVARHEDSEAGAPLDWDQVLQMDGGLLPDPFWSLWRPTHPGGRSAAEATQRLGLLLRTRSPAAWLDARIVRDETLQGRIDAVEADRRMAAMGMSTLPAVETMRCQVHAMAVGSTDGLRAAGRELTAGGRPPAPRDGHTAGGGQFQRLTRFIGVLDPTAGQAIGAAMSRSAAASLTPRELEICRLIGEGLTNRQIADRLVLSVRTVESHVFSARGKLRASRRADIPGILTGPTSLQ